MRSRFKHIAGALLISGSALHAHADTGVPMLFVTLPMMLLALIPIVAIEALVLSRTLAVRYWFTAGWTTVSNLLSTLLGVPLTWTVLVGVQIVTGGGVAHDALNTFRGRLLAVTWQAPWLIPYESELHWMIPAATLTLFVPFFFVSYAAEYAVHKHTIRSHSRVSVARATLLANVASYILLAAYVCALWVAGVGGPVLPFPAVTWITAAALLILPVIVVRKRLGSWWQSVVIGLGCFIGGSLGLAITTIDSSPDATFPWGFLLSPVATAFGAVLGVVIPLVLLRMRRRSPQSRTDVAEGEQPQTSTNTSAGA